MSWLVSNCNYCRTKNIRFDIKGSNKLNVGQWDVLAICSHCIRPTVYRITMKSGIEFPWNETLKKAKNLQDIENLNLSSFFSIGTTMVPPAKEITPCPEYVPENIKTVFDEATLCLSNDCYTASGIMFRLCLDITTKKLLQEWVEANQESPNQPNSSQKNNLYDRIEFLIEEGSIPDDLKEYAHHIRLDGNSAAHDGSTKQEEVEDLLDFSQLFLQRIYTFRKQLAVAQERRIARKQK